MKSDRLQQIAGLASKDVTALIEENEKEILQAYHATIEENQLEEKEASPKLKLSFAIEFDPDKQKLETKLSWTLKRTRCAERKLDDPSQPELEIE